MRRLLALLVATSAVAAFPAAAATFTGVNLSGAEFGGIDGLYGKAYIYPGEAEMRNFRDRGVNVFRVPVLWERLQPALDTALSTDELARLDKVINTANALGVSVIIDVHNYARYRRQSIGSPEVPRAALRDLWQRLANHYKNNPRVIFGMMNEPVRIGARDWASIAGDVIDGIRATGAHNLVLVPGTYWSGAHSWTKPMRVNPSNAEAFAGFSDPADNFAFDMHQYFDAYSSGTTTTCVTADKVEARLSVATNWLRANGQRAMLTEFGAGRSPECLTALRAALEHLRKNPEWIGWTAWGSSAWFGTYAFNLFPTQTPPPPQLDVMAPYFAK